MSFLGKDEWTRENHEIKESCKYFKLKLNYILILDEIYRYRDELAKLLDRLTHTFLTS